MFTLEEDKVLKIAKICHQANKAYCETIGDNSQPEWDAAPDWQKESAIKGVKFNFNSVGLYNSYGAHASHDSWMKEKLIDGWKYGATKDVEKKEHPCLLPYDYLPQEQKMKDFLFNSVIAAFKLELEIQMKEKAEKEYRDSEKNHNAQAYSGGGECSPVPNSGLGACQ